MSNFENLYKSLSEGGMKEKSTNIRSWRNQLVSDIDQFVFEYWLVKNKEDPINFPKTASFGDFDEQFHFWLDSQVKGE